MSRTMPFNLDAEQSVLGAVFLSPNEMVGLMDKLTEEDFYDKRNQKIFFALRNLFNRDEKTGLYDCINRTRSNGCDA